MKKTLREQLNLLVEFKGNCHTKKYPFFQHNNGGCSHCPISSKCKITFDSNHRRNFLSVEEKSEIKLNIAKEKLKELDKLDWLEKLK